MIKDEITHFILSIIAGAVSYMIFDNLWAILVALIFGFLIDSDHIIDYLIYKKKVTFSSREFFTGKFFDYSKKVYVFFHGFEYAIVMALIAIWVIDLRWALIAASLSLVLHLIYDTISNRPKWQTYFILFRLVNNFDHDKFEFSPIHSER